MREAVALTVRNSLNQLSRVFDTINSFLKPLAMSPRNTFSVNLVIEEIFINILNHAYTDDGDHGVVIQVMVENGEIAIRFEDDGAPFNPLSLPRTDRSKPALERMDDGLGMMFVRELRKTMEYDRRNERNILTVYLDLEIQECELESRS